MTRSSADAASEAWFNGIDSRRARQACPVPLLAVVARNLTQLNRVRELRELAVPPGNRPEAALKGRAEASTGSASMTGAEAAACEFSKL